jgi:hypothetical protein
MTAAMNVPSLGTSLFCRSSGSRLVPNIHAKLHTVPGVPTMYMAINQFKGVRRYGISSVSLHFLAAPLPVEVQEALKTHARAAGRRLRPD